MKEKFVNEIPDIYICLLGLDGSRAYGTNHEDSDYDYKGIYLGTTEQLISLNKPKPQYEIKKDDIGLDMIIYEIEKYIRLAMKGNLTILQLLYLDKYNIKTDIGDELVANRELFLGATHIRNSYAGYAMSQIMYLKRNHVFRDSKKIEKHLFHCFRLFDQGQELLETGKITVKVKDPDKLLRISKMSEEEATKAFEIRDKEFRACKTVLPDLSNDYLINKLLIKLRQK